MTQPPIAQAHREHADEFRMLMSGYLDGELDPASERHLEAQTVACPQCRREYDDMKRLVVGTNAALQVDEPDEAVWDTFLDDVYNRVERRSGWLILILGAVALTLYGMFLFVVEPWGSTLTKVLFALPILGLVVLFISVLRQRLRTARSDRYSREVHR